MRRSSCVASVRARCPGREDVVAQSPSGGRQRPVEDGAVPARRNGPSSGDPPGDPHARAQRPAPPRHRHDRGPAYRRRHWATQLAPCAVCGLSKWRLFDDAARAGGHCAIATGHNLDDEVAVLLGNSVRCDVNVPAGRMQVLPAADGFPRRVKPVIRLTRGETAAWCIVRGNGDHIEQHPMPVGNRHLGHEAALNALESRTAGAKPSFCLTFVEDPAPLLAHRRHIDVERLGVRTRRDTDDRHGVRLLWMGRRRRRSRTSVRRPGHRWPPSMIVAIVQRRPARRAPVHEHDGSP